MPGIIVFRRRWSVGSDDLVVPAIFLVALHIIWIIVLGITLGVVDFDRSIPCSKNLHDHVLGYLVILSVCVVLEAVVVCYSMRGTILDAEPRKGMQYLLYTRLVVLVVELAWLVIGVVWVAFHYQTCEATSAKRAIIGIIVCNWAVMLCVLISLWCTFDTAGRSWVKMKRYQESVKVRENRAGHKRRSGSRRRNWRHRNLKSCDSMERHHKHHKTKAMRAYEESWDRRCKILFCCVKEDRHRNSFTEVAKLFTEFFRDLDVVPTDIVAGLVLLRKHQKLRRKFVVSQGSNDVYQFLSGVPITPQSQFLSLKNPDVMADFKNVILYMRYAMAAYGWPLYMMMNARTGLCRIMPRLRCCVCCRCCVRPQAEDSDVMEDNCCQCNVAALEMLLGMPDVELIYVTYHVDIGETPFFIAVDHSERKVVISIRGTLSLQDVLTDLKADAEQLPVEPSKEDWLGHKGMVHAALYIKKKIKDEMLLAKAFGRDLNRGTAQYDLVCVGHSLGAGTAAILAILLQGEYPNLSCYSYSPPGGLLSATCVEETKHFITSVVVGKDVVPRIGLHQLETLRQDLINVIKQSSDPKWKVISGSVLCCCQSETEELTGSMFDVYESLRTEKENRYFSHPSDSEIALTSHTPLFLPGRIIHVVRNHPKDRRLCGREEPVYQALWAENQDFDEVLISPTMVNDHMPDKVMEALEKVLTNVSPAKPTRKLPESERKLLASPKPESFCSECVETQDPSHTHITPEGASYLGQAPNTTADTSQDPSSLVYNQGSECNSMSWDYATLPQPHRHHPIPEQYRSQRTKSFPPPEQSLKQGCRIDMMGNPEWIGGSRDVLAPLASPETLSEASSIDTMNTKRFSDGFQRLQQQLSFSKMTTIPPSPLRPVSSEFSDYQVPAPSPVDGEMLPPMAQSTPMKPEMQLRKGQNHSDDSTLIDLSMTSDLGVSPLPADNTLADQTRLTDIEQRISDKMADMDAQEAYKLTCDLTEDTTGSQESFALHSPDSTSNQCLYSDVNGHYSAAGRGYPHGGFHACDCQPNGDLDEDLEDVATSPARRPDTFDTPPQIVVTTPNQGPIPEVVISSPCEEESSATDCESPQPMAESQPLIANGNGAATHNGNQFDEDETDDDDEETSLDIQSSPRSKVNSITNEAHSSFGESYFV